MAKSKKKKVSKKVVKKQVKESTAKKEVKKAGPGVIASILEFISDNPMTKKRILEKLVKRFPDHSEEAMSHTIGVQLPSRMAKEKKVKITKDKEGRYFAKAKS